MLGENETSLITITQPRSNLPRHIQLLLQPDGHGFAKRPISCRSIRQIRLQQPFKLSQRLVVKSDVVNLLRRDTCLRQAIVDSLLRETLIMLFASKPFLLRSGDQLPINNQSGGRIMVKSRNPKNCGQGRALPLISKVLRIWQNFLKVCFIGSPEISKPSDQNFVLRGHSRAIDLTNILLA